MTVGNKNPSKKFPATLDQLYAMLQLICGQAMELGFDEMELAKIELACEEALVNIISYAYPGKQGEIEIELKPYEKGIEIELTDQGIPYDPVSQSEITKRVLDNPDPIELRKLGGYGIFFILTLMDDVSYSREGDNNVLKLIKYKSSEG